MSETGIRPLKGLKIVDMTIYVAAPAATSVLGYLGADVVKLEPVKGDPYRMTGIGFGLPATQEDNPLFDTCNSFKRCMAVNFRSEAGKAVVRRMVEQADIFVTNYRENALEGMGFTYQQVKQMNPRIVYGKVDGYGEQGEDNMRQGYDATAFFARSGFANEGAYTNAPPMTTPSGAGDTITSMALAVGLMSAYIEAKRTGVGSKVHTSLYSSALWTLASPIARHQITPRKPDRWGEPGFLSVNGDYRCKDGTWVRFCGMEAERTWTRFCNALGLEEYLEDKRFTTSLANREHAKEGFDLIQARVEQRNYAEWAPIFREHDLPYEKVMTPVEAARDEQAIANNYVNRMSYCGGEYEVYLPMPPFKISGMEEKPKDKAPKLGEHTRQVMAEYGFAGDEVEALLAGGDVVQL